MTVQLPVLPIRTATEYRQAFIRNYQDAMAEIDRQLAELPGVMAECQSEVG